MPIFSQNNFLLICLIYDICLIYKVHDYHISSSSDWTHKETYRIFFDDFRAKIPKPIIILFLHIASAIIPLIGSILQVSTFIRSKSIAFHRWNGRLVIINALISGLFAIPISFTQPDNGPLEHLIIFGFSCLWLLSSFLTW